jgi:hypothetical protein
VAREVGRGTTERSQPARQRQIRVRYVNGVLVPSEPLEISEGTELLLDIRVNPKD